VSPARTATLEPLVDFPAEAVDQHLHDVRLRGEVKVPHVLQDHGFRYHLSLVSHEKLEQGKLPRLQVNFFSAACNGSRHAVELDRAGGEGGPVRGPGVAADERLHAGEKLCERERFGEVVVAAGLKALHPLIDGAFCAQDEHRRGVSSLAPSLDQAEAVARRKHEVDHGRVVVLVKPHSKALLAVARPVHDVSRLLESLPDESGNLVVVFYEQEPHKKGGVRSG
jgi:hypothetical protein